MSTDFGNPHGPVLGLLAAVLSLGAICGTPFISFVGDRWGRRVGIIVGSAIMAIGGIIQGASVHGKTKNPYTMDLFMPNVLGHHLADDR